MKVYLAILEERSTDDDIRVFSTHEGAKGQIEEWRAEYPHVTEYESESYERTASLNGQGDNLLLLMASDDQEEGMVMSIEEREVH